jgi:hypothetical protein
MQFNVKTAFERWSAVDHPLLKFAALTHHPDIRLAMPVEMPLQPAATSTLVAALVILPIQTAQTTENVMYKQIAMHSIADKTINTAAVSQ